MRQTMMRSSKVELSNSGGVITSSSTRDALLATLFNKPTRGKRCPIILACFDAEASSDFKHHRRNDLLALVDAQGEIYCMSMAENDYFSVRFVPQPISSVCFVPSNRYCLIVAYENTGMVVLFNLKTKTVMGNLQMPRDILSKFRRNKAGPTAVRLISCHAKLPLAVMVSDNNTVTLWDLKKYQCIHTLECEEAIVDVRFELDGDAIAVTRLTSGVYLYAVVDRRLLMHLTLPETERKPQWTAYCSHRNKVTSSTAFSVASESNTNKEFSILVAGNNSMVYSWLISANRTHKTREAAGETTMWSNRTSVLVPTSGLLVAVVELPVAVNAVIKMTLLHGHINPARICMLCDTGDVLLVEVSNLSQNSMGTYTVLAEISSANGDASPPLTSLGPQFHPVQIGMAAQFNVHESCLGKLDSCDGYLVSVGRDGSARLFDGDKFIDSNGRKMTQLRCRRPFGTNGRTEVRPDLTSHRTNNSTLTSDVPALDNTFEEEEEDGELSSSTNIQRNQQGISRYAHTSQAFSSLNHSSKNSGQESGRSSSGTKQSYSLRSGSTGASNGASRSKGHSSLFELAALTPKEQRVNEEKLKKFLHSHGEFPSRYRPLIWRFLMKLPENTVAFSNLVSRGTHAAFANLHDKYPLQSKRIFLRLQATCSLIAHWAPILAEAPYLPSLVFPFLLVFGRDELATFEMVMSIMIWWGHSWHVTHPNPPLHILDCCDGLLKFHDPRLYQHFNALNVSVGVVCWSMISSFFSEVLNRADWLAFVDFIVANFERIELMLCIPIAIIHQLKGSLLTGQTADQLINFCRSQQGGIRVKDCIKKSLDLIRNTPPKYFAATTTQLLDGLHAQNLNGIRKASTGMDEKEIANINLALHGGRPLFPLSKVKYPIYDGYPKQIVDLQLKERSKVLAMERELIRRESSLQQLQTKVREADDEHTAWMQAHARGSEADAKYRKEIMEKEKQYLLQLQYIEEETSKQRLLALESMEAAAREEILLMETVSKTSHQMLTETEKHLREKMEISLAVQKHRELAAEAELRMEERVRKLRLRRSRDDWVANMSESLRQKEEEYTSRDSLLSEQWQSEDMQQRLQKQIRDEQRIRFEEEDRLNRMQEEINDKLQRLELERATKLKEIERQRSVRAAKEQAAEALEAASRSQQILRTSQARLSAEGRATELAERGTHLLDTRLVDTLNHISEESNRLLEMERVHLQRQQSLLQQATEFKYRRQWADKAEQQAKFIMAAESDLQRQLLVLQRAAMTTETEMLKQLQDQPLGAPDGKRESNFEELGERVLRQQRERFREMQQFFEKQQQQMQQDYLKQQRQQRASSSGDSSGGIPARLMTLSPAISTHSEKSSSSASSDATQEWARPRQVPLDLDDHNPVQSFPDLHDEVKFVSSASDDNTFSSSSSKGSSPTLPMEDAIQSANKMFLNHNMDIESTGSGSGSDLGLIMPTAVAPPTNRYTTQKTFSKKTNSQSTQISKASRNVQESRTLNREEKAMEEENEDLGQQYSYNFDSTSAFREDRHATDFNMEERTSKKSAGVYSVWTQKGVDSREGAMVAAAAAAAASAMEGNKQEERSIDNDSALWAFEESSSDDDSTS